MGLFDFFKGKNNKEKQAEEPKELLDDVQDNESEDEDSTLAIAMPMFCGHTFNAKAVIADLQSYWGLTISDTDDVSDDGDSPAIFHIDGMMVALMFIGAKIPNEELEPLFDHSYLWNTVRDEVPTHTAHAIVSVMGADDKVSAYKLLTMVNASILRTNENAIGVYQGGATLLLPKGLYCDFAEFLKNDNLPVLLWVFMGIVHQENSCSLYTYGLAEFGRMEMEIIDSPMQASELHEFMTMTVAYLLDYDVYLQDGETIGFSEDHKISISESQAVYLDGNSLKLAM